MKKISVILSNATEKWKEVPPSSILSPNLSKAFDIVVNTNKKYQRHQGFGGAFTDASVENYLKLDEKEKAKFIDAYFSRDGLNYNLGRYPIHSTDFSSHSYNYLGQGVKNLEMMDLDVDKEKIDLVRKCSDIADGLRLMMSVWSPFEWMKDNRSLYHGGKLLYDFYQPWAKYLATVLDGLINRGVNITAITAQNEPEASQTWESCRFTGKEEGRFVNYLYDELSKADRDNIHIYLVDHNRDLLPKRVTDILSICRAPVYGIAYHWYDHSCFDNLAMTHQTYPSYHLLMSECCVELLVSKDPIGSLQHAEQYAYEMIKDFNNYSEGYIDWNLLLDEKGGPNHVGNYCESPIMMDGDKFKLLPTYYYIGHFSRFISPGSIRVETINNSELEAVSYVTPKGKIVIVLLNRCEHRVVSNISLSKISYQVEIDSHSIATILFG